MYIIEQSRECAVVADDPKDAVRKAEEKRKGSSAKGEPQYFKIWDTINQDFFVLTYEGDKFDCLTHLTRSERTKLIDTMKMRALTDKIDLQRICELAALQITDRTSYSSWVKED